jgi:hypothetical protein
VLKCAGVARSVPSHASTATGGVRSGHTVSTDDTTAAADAEGASAEDQSSSSSDSADGAMTAQQRQEIEDSAAAVVRAAGRLFGSDREGIVDTVIEISGERSFYDRFKECMSASGLGTRKVVRSVIPIRSCRAAWR